MTDATTAKTFDEILETIRCFRYSEYINRRTQFLSIVDYKKNAIFKSHQSLKSSNHSSCFSAIDDPHYYNEAPCPDAQTIVDFFIKYTEERKEELNQYQMDIDVSDVISIDSTFHVQKTTKRKNIGNKSYSTVAEDAALFVLNGSGEVIEKCICKGETAPTLKQVLKSVKNKRIQQGKTDTDQIYVFVDNAQAWVIFILLLFTSININLIIYRKLL